MGTAGRRPWRRAAARNLEAHAGDEEPLHALYYGSMVGAARILVGFYLSAAVRSASSDVGDRRASPPRFADRGRVLPGRGPVARRIPGMICMTNITRGVRDMRTIRDQNTLAIRSRIAPKRSPIRWISSFFSVMIKRVANRPMPWGLAVPVRAYNIRTILVQGTVCLSVFTHICTIDDRASTFLPQIYIRCGTVCGGVSATVQDSTTAAIRLWVQYHTIIPRLVLMPPG